MLPNFPPLFPNDISMLHVFLQYQFTKVYFLLAEFRREAHGGGGPAERPENRCVLRPPCRDSRSSIPGKYP